MSQKDILDYLFKVNRPIKKQELRFLNISNVSITRNLSQLQKYGFIESTKGKIKKPSLYSFKK